MLPKSQGLQAAIYLQFVCSIIWHELAVRATMIVQALAPDWNTERSKSLKAGQCIHGLNPICREISRVQFVPPNFTSGHLKQGRSRISLQKWWVAANTEPNIMERSPNGDASMARDSRSNHDLSTVKKLPFNVVYCSGQVKLNLNARNSRCSLKLPACLYRIRSVFVAQWSAVFIQVETYVKSLMQDEDYPASELNKDVSGRGWQSSRFYSTLLIWFSLKNNF